MDKPETGSVITIIIIFAVIAMAAVGGFMNCSGKSGEMDKASIRVEAFR